MHAPVVLCVLAGSAACLAAGPFPASLDLGDHDETNGCLVRGMHKNDSCAIVASAGDINHDGIPDILIGASLADPDRRQEAGQVYVQFGTPTIGAGGELDLASLSGPNGFTTNAGECYIVFGRAPVACVGDISGDGHTTILDFNILAAWFGQSVPPGTNGDLNGDGLVNIADFGILAGNFGCSP